MLRAATGALAKKFNRVDYFPSYEIIASPWSRGFFYEPNMRSVSPAGVSTVMRVFFGEHGQSDAPAEPRRPQRAGRAGKPAREPGTWKERRKARQQKAEQSAEDAICEDLLLEAFAPQK